jgi:hypothetical protein
VWFSEVNFKRKYFFGPDSTGDVWHTEGSVFRVKFYFKYIGKYSGPKLNFWSSEGLVLGSSTVPIVIAE